MFMITHTLTPEGDRPDGYCSLSEASALQYSIPSILLGKFKNLRDLIKKWCKNTVKIIAVKITWLSEIFVPGHRFLAAGKDMP